MEGRDGGRAEAEGEELLRPVTGGEGRAGPGRAMPGPASGNEACPCHYEGGVNLSIGF